MTWVTGEALERSHGYTDGQRRARVQTKRWRRGVEYALIDGVRMFDPDAIDARATEQAQRQRDEQASSRPRMAVRRLV